MIEFLLFAGVIAQVGVVHSAGGESIDFGPGAKCMFTLPDGFLVDASSSDEFLIRFNNRALDEKKWAQGSARVLDRSEYEERRNAPKPNLRTYKNATIESSVDTRDGISVSAFEVVIGHQVIAFIGLTTAAMPKPEEVVDACGPAKQAPSGA